MMSGVPLETCRAFKKLWNNKFYYIVASCWYFYWAREGFSFAMYFKPRSTSVAYYTGGGRRYSSHRLGRQKYWSSFPSFQISSSANPASHSVTVFDCFPRVNGDRSVKVTTYFSIWPRLRMRRTVPPFILTPLWREEGQCCLDLDK
jgi:hypothetical protein